MTFALIVPSFMLILSMLSTAQKFNTSVFKYIITAVCCSRTKHFNIQWKRRQFWLAVFIAYNCSWSFVSLSLLLFLYVLALHMKNSIGCLMFHFILIFSGKFLPYWRHCNQLLYFGYERRWWVTFANKWFNAVWG